MAGFLVIAILVVMVIGVQKNVRQATQAEICRKTGLPDFSYNFALTVVSGLAALVAMVGLVMVAAGSADKVLMVLAGLAVSVAACLPEIQKANENARVAKNHGKDASGFAPAAVWLNIMLIGVGKVVHAVMVCTLIGIPLYNMLAQVQQNMDALVEQIELRREIEELKRSEQMHAGARAAQAELDAKRQGEQAARAVQAAQAAQAAPQQPAPQPRQNQANALNDIAEKE